MSKKLKEPTDAEIRRSQERTAERDAIGPRAASAWYVPDDDKIAIMLRNGIEFRIPREKIQGLQDAAPTQVADILVTASGNALHWEQLDVQMSVEGLFNGIFGTQAWMDQQRKFGAIGGKARTPAKSAAARANGKKGGRPRKVAA